MNKINNLNLCWFLLFSSILIGFFNCIAANNNLTNTNFDDSIIIEATPGGTQKTRSGRQLFYQPHLTPISSSSSTCVTSKGQIGNCMSYKNCYPQFKAPDLTIWESWILGNYDTCSFFNNEGRQAFGICCSITIQEQQQNALDFDKQQHHQISNKDNNYPNWPPPIPTHPPNHSAPTHPTHPTISQFPSSSPVTAITTHRPPTTWPTRPRPPSSPLPTPPSHYPSWPPSIITHPTHPTYPAHPTHPPNRPQKCGTKNESPDQNRIVGGHNAEPNEWPWIVVIFDKGHLLCGGSLIDNSHILTAAHCVAQMTPIDVAGVTVRLGDHNIKSNTEVQHVERRIKRLVRHRGFEFRTLHNDIALLTMNSPVAFTHTVQPICLPTASSKLYTGSKATAIGWGSLRENGPSPSILQEVTLPIWSNDECRRKYGSYAPAGVIESMLCAGQQSKDTCRGDSGGPLAVNEGGSWIQVGLVSWGISCGKGEFPGVYTRVTHFLPWIMKNIKDT